MDRIITTLILAILFISCGIQSEDHVNNELKTIDEKICNCFQQEHEKIGINFFKEFNTYKEYLAKISLSKHYNFPESLLSNYEAMENKTFETRPADTVFQKNYLESFNVKIVQECISIHANDKTIAELIQRLDQVGLSDSFSNEEQLEILKTLEKELINYANIGWVEPLQLNAFFYMYDRYNKAASQTKIEVLQEQLLPPPPPAPIPIPPVEEPIETEDIEETPIDQF